MFDGLLNCRSQFPALSRQVAGRPAVFFDGPAGSQVPRSVADAVSDYLLNRNAKHGGFFATSRESDALLLEAQRALADLLGAENPAQIVFGANMTTLTFALSRSIAARWQEGDEAIVTHLDHDANVTPWVRAARERVPGHLRAQPALDADRERAPDARHLGAVPLPRRVGRHRRERHRTGGAILRTSDEMTEMTGRLTLLGRRHRSGA